MNRVQELRFEIERLKAENAELRGTLDNMDDDDDGSEYAGVLMSLIEDHVDAILNSDVFAQKRIELMMRQEVFSWRVIGIAQRDNVSE